MAGALSLFGALRRSFSKSSCKTVSVIDNKQMVLKPMLEKSDVVSRSPSNSYRPRFSAISIEDAAAIKIQAHFRGHLVCFYFKIYFGSYRIIINRVLLFLVVSWKNLLQYISCFLLHQ